MNLRLALIGAVLATSALAAPRQLLSKRHFTAPVAGRGQHSPQSEVLRTHRKYGWEIIVVEPAGDASITSTVQASAPSSAATAFAATSAPSAPPYVPSGTPTYGNSSSTASASSTSATATSEDGEVTATPETNDSEYLSPVTIGGQEFNLDFDTGSADLWVFSADLSHAEIGQHAAFDPNQSKTWQDLADASWQIRYGDNSFASGTVGFDIVDVGGSTVAKQCVEIASAMSESFVIDENSDGLLGLGFSSINMARPTRQKTFFDNVMNELTLPLFSVDLTDATGKGTYEFGTIDKTKFVGDIHYAAVDNSHGFWQFDSPTYTVGGKQHSCTACNPAIADTGTSLVFLDEDIVEAFYADVRSAEYDPSIPGMIYECSETLPDIGIAIGDGYVATMNGSETTFAPVGSAMPGFCVGGIQKSQQDFQILGDVFLKQFFAVFDGGNMQFGVAEQD